MFLECHDAMLKYPSYINCDKISEIQVKDYISSEDGKSYGFVIEAFVVVSPSNSRTVSEIYHTKEDAEKALAELIKKMNKRK